MRRLEVAPRCAEPSPKAADLVQHSDCQRRPSVPANMAKNGNQIGTLWLTHMEVENGPLEDYFPLDTGGFPLPCYRVGV